MPYNKNAYLVALGLVALLYVSYRLQLAELSPSRYSLTYQYARNSHRTRFNPADGGGAFIQSHLGPMGQHEFAPIYHRRFDGS